MAGVNIFFCAGVFGVFVCVLNCTHVQFEILSRQESLRICAWIARAECEIFSLFSDKIFQNSFSLVVILCCQ